MNEFIMEMLELGSAYDQSINALEKTNIMLEAQKLYESEFKKTNESVIHVKHEIDIGEYLEQVILNVVGISNNK